MSKVRCAGMPQPLNSAYSKASPRPAQAAATGAGQRRHNAGLRRHRPPTSATASQANMVICNPLMLTRCATPVSRSKRQSSLAMAA